MAESGTMPGDEFHESVSEEQKVVILEILNVNNDVRKRLFSEAGLSFPPHSGYMLLLFFLIKLSERKNKR